ncbi:MAG: OpgC family protein [Gemmatimonas sp.]
MTTAAVRSATPLPISRDLRLDFFRGLALVFIFIDHIPDNLLADFTIRNIGFSDATEMFVYISGYTAGLVYMAAMLREGWLFASARIMRRVWQLYMAHIALFVIFTAQVAWTASQFDNPEYAEEMNVMSFLHEPHVAIVQALLLSFKPVNLDVLPLYVVLLAGFPVALWLIAHNRIVTVVLSFALYVAATAFKWNLPGYPPGSEWFFNPLAWQFLFVLGAALGSLGATDNARFVDMPGGGWLRERWVAVAAVAYLVFSLAITVSWSFAEEDTAFLPTWLSVLYPISKTYMSPWRLVHFLALAYVTMRLCSQKNPFFASRWARPLVLIGESGLQMFCISVFLSFAAHFVLVEVNGEAWMQMIVNAVGIGIMLAVAAMIHWYKTTERGRAAAQRRRAVATAEGVAE